MIVEKIVAYAISTAILTNNASMRINDSIENSCCGDTQSDLMMPAYLVVALLLAGIVFKASEKIQWMLLAGYGGFVLGDMLSFTQAGNLADMRYQTQEKNDCTKFTCRTDNGLVPVFQYGGMVAGVLIAYAMFPKTSI